MIGFIDSYETGRLNFPQLVVSLQSALDAGEFKDQALFKRWYSFWTPLEIRRAVVIENGSGVKKESAF